MTKDLQKENEILRKKLEVAQAWMKREIQNQIHSISRKNILQDSAEQNTKLISDEMENIMTERILQFFASLILTNAPEDMIENLVKSEIHYHLLTQGNNIDPLSITMGYQRVIEGLIENFITTDFRSFAQKKGLHDISNENNLEASLKNTLEKGHSLGIARLYHILSLLRSKSDLGVYGKLFGEYLDAYSFLKNTLLEEKFFIQLESVVESEVFSTKRHSGTVSSEEVNTIRDLCMGNFKNTDCLVYKLFQTQETL